MDLSFASQLWKGSLRKIGALMFNLFLNFRFLVHWKCRKVFSISKSTFYARVNSNLDLAIDSSSLRKLPKVHLSELRNSYWIETFKILKKVEDTHLICLHQLVSGLPLTSLNPSNRNIATKNCLSQIMATKVQQYQTT